MISTAIEPEAGIERDGDRRRDHRVFEDQIVEPVERERRIRTFHDALPFAASGFVIVVLASHSPASNTVLRVRGTKPRFSKNPRALSLASTVSSLLPRAAASFSSASHSMAPAP